MDGAVAYERLEAQRVRDTGGFARICDMEPGMFFRERVNRHPYEFVGIDPVDSKFPNKDHVRVVTREGVSWVCEKWQRFPLLTTEARV